MPRGVYQRQLRTPCSVSECQRLVKCKGLCSTHYMRWRRDCNLDSTIVVFATDLDRLLSKIDKNGPIPDYAPQLGSCWIWQAPTNAYGYGTFGVGGRTNQRIYLAHRFTYEMFVGAIPLGLDIDHLCRVRNCVNPAHLEPVTRRDNLLRGETTAARLSSLTQCHRGHLFDEANTHRNDKGQRSCRACGAIRARQYRRQRATR